MKKIKAYFLVGPTGTGKTAVAHSIALKNNWSILSADSMLVYRGMNIGTDKPSTRELQEVRYYGVDLVEPNKNFSVGDYCEYLVAQREKIFDAPGLIVVGGTGLYVKALLQGLAPLPSADRSKREQWNNILSAEGVDGLRRELRKKAPAILAQLKDSDNPRRLIRALEMAESGFAALPSDWDKKGNHPVLTGLIMNPLLHRSVIEDRVRRMYCQGLLEETRSLLKKHGALSRTALQAIGYREAFDLDAGSISQEEAIAKTTVRTSQLAKRQRTWFRHQAQVDWVEHRQESRIELLVAQIEESWSRNGHAVLAL